MQPILKRQLLFEAGYVTFPSAIDNHKDVIDHVRFWLGMKTILLKMFLR